MSLTPDVSIRKILILREDRLYAEALGIAALSVFPSAQITVATSVQSAATILAVESVDLLISGIGPCIEGDVLELLMRWIQLRPQTQRVLVVTSDRQYRTLDALRKLEVAGVFDSSQEKPGELPAALKTVCAGGRYWSQSVVDFMIQTRKTSTPLTYLLTAGEQVVLSIVGDGSDDASAASQLGISPATVSTVRRDLHRKLGVQHRGELIRVAAQNGFVQFTPNGVTRPGFALYSATYYARRSRRTG